MPTIIRPIDPRRDFKTLAAWFTILEDDYSSEASLSKWYEENKERVLAGVAEEEGEEHDGALAGFYWATRHAVTTEQSMFDLFVPPERRGRGLGSSLYTAMLQAVTAAGARTLRARVKDADLASRAFIERRGFSLKRHSIAMELDLASFDDAPYQAVIDRLTGEGYRFTSMEALGDTEDARRKLFALNDSATADTPGSIGEHPWADFADFQKRVCQAEWYKPAGQMVVLDPASDEFAAMSAITRNEGNAFAYNLFTGTRRDLRNRKLGQSVKVTALRYARDVLGARTARTHHNDLNLPMIAIDRKLGYHVAPGNFWMEKQLEK